MGWLRHQLLDVEIPGLPPGRLGIILNAKMKLGLKKNTSQKGWRNFLLVIDVKAPARMHSEGTIQLKAEVINTFLNVTIITRETMTFVMPEAGIISFQTSKDITVIAGITGEPDAPSL